MAVDPRLIYRMSHAFAEAVQNFIHEHGEDWDGGGTGYDAAALHAQAEELLHAIEGARDA